MEQKPPEGNPNEQERVKKEVSKGVTISYGKGNEDVIKKIRDGIISSIIILGILYLVYYQLWQLKGFEFTMMVMLYFFTISVPKYLMEIRDELKKIAEKK